MNNESNFYTVEEFTSPIGLYFTPQMKLKDALAKSFDVDYRHFPVLSNGKAVGVVSNRDLALFYTDTLFGELDELEIHDIIDTEPYIVHKEENIENVAFEMSKRKIGSALVAKENGDIEGVFTSTDALNALVELVRGVRNEM